MWSVILLEHQHVQGFNRLESRCALVHPNNSGLRRDPDGVTGRKRAQRGSDFKKKHTEERDKVQCPRDRWSWLRRKLCWDRIDSAEWINSDELCNGSWLCPYLLGLAGSLWGNCLSKDTWNDDNAIQEAFYWSDWLLWGHLRGGPALWYNYQRAPFNKQLYKEYLRVS